MLYLIQEHLQYHILNKLIIATIAFYPADNLLLIL
jgi:hypothetical protein